MSNDDNVIQFPLHRPSDDEGSSCDDGGIRSAITEAQIIATRMILEDRTFLCMSVQPDDKGGATIKAVVGGDRDLIRLAATTFDGGFHEVLNRILTHEGLTPYPFDDVDERAETETIRIPADYWPADLSTPGLWLILSGLVIIVSCLALLLL